ncbi:MAG: DUF47 family protein [Lachnospiraceae bacterium]|nr:DUF47 family protein [Lachnospiraceae bacterium]
MAKKDNNYYFEAFAKGISYANDAAALLQDIFENFDAEGSKALLDRMHTIEHTADGVKHEMMERLVKEFLPPIEREDIVELAHTIDEVCDLIEDVVLRIYMYNIKELRPDVKDFAKLIARCCADLKEMSVELPNYRKSASLIEKIKEVNSWEEEGDRLYMEATRRLYSEEKDPVAVFAWTNIYDRLEKCCDGCEKVADTVELIILKNS